jgi:hypothetical protein
MALARAVHAPRRRGSPVAAIGASAVDRVVGLTLTEPPSEATHWTGRAMAAATGVSLCSVQRIWAAHRMQPHSRAALQAVAGSGLAAKLRDVVGLYLTPPAHSLVLSVDAMSADKDVVVLRIRYTACRRHRGVLPNADADGSGVCRLVNHARALR